VLDYLAPTGTPLQETEKMAQTLEDVLNENPDVDVYVRRTGTELGLFATKTNRGDIQVVLRPAENDPISLIRKRERPKFSDVEKELKEVGSERARQKYGEHFTEAQMWAEGKAAIRQKYRRRSGKAIRDEIEEELKEKFGEHQLSFELIQIMEDELNDLSGANKPIEVKLFGRDYRELRELGGKVADKFEKDGKGRGFREPKSNVYEGNPDLMVIPDRYALEKVGLSAQEIERQLRAIYLGQIATQLRESAERVTDVRVRYPDSVRFGTERFEPHSLLNQWLLVPEANVVGTGAKPTTLSGVNRALPLSAVARVERVRTPDEQMRENLQPVVIVTSEIDESQAGLGSVVADIRQWMGETSLPSGYRWELGGHYLQQQEAFRSLTVVMVVAILLVFIMLAFQFRSLLLPLLIFLTQPLSLVSGLFALWITDTPLNVSSYMGAILLIGLDMKNGILLVEYIQQLRSEGMELQPALLQAGRTRFRPILMTSLAAILGLFPLALGIGPGAQMQQPLAIMVIGGLTANMLFTRVVIPVGFLEIERWKARLGGAAAR
jgi:multidrug efflux pump subunit AcrB